MCFCRQKVKGPAKVIDTGAGFYLEEDDEEDKLMANIPIKHAPGRWQINGKHSYKACSW